MLAENFSIFEVAMLMSFAISWPISIIKTLRTKFVLGKSLTFMFIVLLGYVFGIIHKMRYSHDIVIWCYFLNFFFVAFDISLYFYFSNKKKKMLQK